MLSILPVEELCRKLRPIFGSKIEKVYLKYTLAKSIEERFEIEQALNALYHKHLNDSILNEKILLEPPKEEEIKGEYPLGTVTYADRNLYSFGLREKDWIRHVCISGMSGSGKTMFAFQILNDFIKFNKPFIIFDWKKSFRPLTLVDPKLLVFTVGNKNIANNFRININRPPKNVDAREWINILTDLIVESFSASYGVHKILSETLDSAFRDFGVYKGSDNYPTWYQIKDRLEEKEEAYKGNKRESEWITSSLRIAHSLCFGGFGESINYKGADTFDIDSLDHLRVLFELNSLNTMEKKFFCEFLLMYIYKSKKVNSESCNSFKQAILVDEAHNIFLKDKPMFVKETVTDTIYREIREYGVGLICLDQHISKLSDTVAGNSACNIAFQQVLFNDITTVSGIMQLSDKKKYFSMLPVGYAIVKLADRFYNPFMIRCPYIELKDQHVSDEVIKGRIENLFNRKTKPEIQEYLVNHIIREMKRGISLEVLKNFLIKNNFREEDVLEAIKLLDNKVYKSSKVDISHSYSLTNEQKQLLRLLEKNPQLGITQVYKLFNLSARKGNELKNSLIEMGLISVQENRNNSGWNKTLVISQKGKKLLSSVLSGKA